MRRELALAAACAFAATGVAAQDTPAPTVTIRSFGPLPTSVQKLLTEAAESTLVKIPPGADPYAMVRSRCGGSVTNDFLADVERLNPGFKMSAQPGTRELNLPPCIKVAKNTGVKVLPGDSVETITRRLIGVSAGQAIPVCNRVAGKPAGFTSCRLPASEAFAAVNGGKPIAPTDLVPGRVLTAPTVTWPTTISLKRNVDSKALAAQINEALAAAGGQQSSEDAAVPEAGLRLIKPLESQDAKVQGTSCAADQVPGKPWPFDVRAVADRLREGKAMAAQRGFLNGPAVVRVADTGFRGIGAMFPLDAIAANRLETASQPYDKDRNTYIADKYGFDADNAGDLEPYADDPYRQHGTQVADMALGGMALRSAYPDVFSLVKLSFVKVYWKRAGGISVKDDAIYQAMSHIGNHTDPRVVNFSVGSGDENSTRMFVMTLRNAAQLNMLAVLAAGNDSQNIGERPTYPASYGGLGSDVSERILSVGAVAPDGSLAPFSNFSRGRVDLLAPGCRVAFSPDGAAPQYLNGTSIAAPLVTFTAAALNALGISEMPLVKQRILVSADHHPALESSTRLGGVVLNVERALSIYDDVLRVRGGQDRAGTWVRPNAALRVCESGESVNPSRLLSLSTYQDGAATRVRVLHTEFDGRLAEPINCAAGTAELTFQDKAGQRESVPLRNLAVLVPRFPFPAP